MKKQLKHLLTIGFAFCCAAAFAQDDSSPNETNDSSWGLKFGASRHWQNEGSFNFDADLGFLGGMYFMNPKGKYIATSYEWQVMQMGYRINETTSSNLEKIVINRTYIQVLYNFHFTPANFIDISLGAYGGFAVNSNEKWHFTSGVDERDEENNLRQFDAGAKLSASFWLNRIGLGLEYYHGFVNTDTETGPDFVFTNRAVSLSAKWTMK